MPPSNPPPDRILDGLLMQSGQEATQRTRNPGLRRDEPYLLNLRRRQYQSIVEGYSNRRDLSREERQSLTYVRAQLRKLNTLLRPTRITRLRYWPPVDWLINWFRGRAALTDGFNRRIQEEDRTTTRDQNIQRLTQELKKAGFNISMEGPLKRVIAQDRPWFYLSYAASDDARTEYNLFFSKLPGTDTYYLEGFDAAPKMTVTDSLRATQHAQRQHFSLIDDPPFNAREAANLVHQVPVAKVVDGRECWAIIDGMGNRAWVDFNLEQHLNHYPIKELQEPARKAALLGALRTGFDREVTLTGSDGQPQKLRVQIDPLARDLLFKDCNGSHVDPGRFLHANQNIGKILARSEHQGIVRQMSPGRRG
jgi:hypothetical protein